MFCCFIGDLLIEFQLKKRLCHTKKSHTIGILENLVGICRLSFRQSNREII